MDTQYEDIVMCHRCWKRSRQCECNTKQPLGWRCPVCGRGLAPDVKECSCDEDLDYSPQEFTSSGDNTLVWDMPSEAQDIHELKLTINALRCERIFGLETITRLEEKIVGYDVDGLVGDLPHLPVEDAPPEA